MAETKDTIIKTYEFKLRTNKSFVEACERELEHSRQIYNAALAERISCYRITGASLSYTEQSRRLTDARTLHEVKSHLRTIQQDALERIDEAFIGVDVGITAFATLSNGEEIENPRRLKNALENLQRQQRRLSRKKKGSKRRAKQRIKVACAHLKVARCRKDFHHKVSTDLVRRFDAITVEDLNIRGMVRNRHLAQAISDVAWGRFFKMTKSKAENAGRTFERVDPKYTSQICSGCGQRQKMPLAMRIYECSKCGIVIGRDHNSAITIDRAEQAQITTPVEKRGSVSNEAGTRW